MSNAALAIRHRPAGSRPNMQVCTVCVMDSSDPGVTFDESGQCNCCRDAFQRLPHEWFPNEEGRLRLERLAGRLREEGRRRPYDAIVGLSGGIDSAFLAHLMAREHGLRLLAVHVDGGWNSAPAVANIEAIVRGLDLDLHTHVIEWSEMRDVQLAFLKAGVLNQDFPQDHAFFATLYRQARLFDLPTFLSGVNFSSESVTVPKAGMPPSIDGRHVRAIHDRFGQQPLVNYPVMTLPAYLLQTRLRGRPRIERPLDYMAYDKEAAREVLRQQYGWRDYGGKHSESRFTKFYQDIFLPRKFGIDKRRLHLSSLVVAGQLDRREALESLEDQPISDADARRDIRFVAKKLGLSPQELENLIDAPPVPHSNYESDYALVSTLQTLRKRFRDAVGTRG